jgi:hypothetical protein
MLPGLARISGFESRPSRHLFPLIGKNGEKALLIVPSLERTRCGRQQIRVNREQCLNLIVDAEEISAAKPRVAIRRR